MGRSTFSPNVGVLLEGLKPFMVQNKREVAEGISGVINLINSEQGQQAVHDISKLFLLPASPGTGISVNTVEGSITLNLASPFLLFLILILLILSGNLLSIGAGPTSL